MDHPGIVNTALHLVSVWGRRSVGGLSAAAGRPLHLRRLRPGLAQLHLVRAAHVVAEVGALGSEICAEGALVGPLAGVRADVVLEVLVAGELLGAVRALVHALAGASPLADCSSESIVRSVVSNSVLVKDSSKD